MEIKATNKAKRVVAETNRINTTIRRYSSLNSLNTTSNSLYQSSSKPHSRKATPNQAAVQNL